MTQRLRYYRTTAGSDHIPDPWQWVDTVVPPALFILAFSIMMAAICFGHLWS
ncbi:hypothetical protein NKH72_21845 [Mesorhizobium sp. M0955]|uniref:hypothetical protein n=1 Tax=Mesorhizobium sp. M0955 TaxID=2957033 RepID=UPI00333CDEB0